MLNKVSGQNCLLLLTCTDGKGGMHVALQEHVTAGEREAGVGVVGGHADFLR